MTFSTYGMYLRLRAMKARNGLAKTAAITKGAVMPRPKVMSRLPPCHRLSFIAAIIRIEASTGPTQAVQPNPKARPMT